MDSDHLASLVNSVDPDQLAFEVYNVTCELVIINQNMKYRLYSLYTFILVQGQVNRNFQLVLHEMGSGQISRAWYFHSPVLGAVRSGSTLFAIKAS